MFYILFFGFYFFFLGLVYFFLRKLFFSNISKIVLILGLILGLILIMKRRRIKNFIRKEVKEIHVPKNDCSTIVGNLDVQKFDYKTFHRPKAIEITRNGYIKNQKVLNLFLKSKRLVEIEENDGYYIQHLNFSSKHLTPFAYKRLIELGKLFRAKIKDKNEKKSYFIISSITRDEDQQKKVRVSNPNTATKGVSTHSFGVSFDISRIHSNINCSAGIKALSEALAQMQNEKKILLCTESSCVHVTVIK